MTFICYPKCTTCQKAQKWLDENGISYTFRDIKMEHPTYAAFHERFIKGHITLVGCPKLDSVDYAEKLTEIIRENDIKSVTVVRMEVPCCGGLEMAAKKALQQSGKFIPWQVVTVTVDGRLVEE